MRGRIVHKKRVRGRRGRGRGRGRGGSGRGGTSPARGIVDPNLGMPIPIPGVGGAVAGVGHPHPIPGGNPPVAGRNAPVAGRNAHVVVRGGDLEKELQRGAIQPQKGMNYMEEQYVKYGMNLGNYHPVPIMGTDSMASVYKSHNMTPEERSHFGNWRGSGGGVGQHEMMKYIPKGIDYKMYGDRFHKATVLEDSERLVENSVVSGITSADQIRNTYRPDLAANEGNWSSSFLSSG